MQLPLLSEIKALASQWKSLLDPVVANPLNGVSILSNVVLANGTTVINHKLDQRQQGWFLVDVNAAATIYRSQPFNSKTLTLVSNAAVTVSIGVY